MFVVLFSTTEHDDVDVSEYRRTSGRMRELVSHVPGFISYNSYGSDDGTGVAVVRFDAEEALNAWRTLPEHRAAQERGRDEFYGEYWVQVCETVRAGSRGKAGTSTTSGACAPPDRRSLRRPWAASALACACAEAPRA
ncbi:MAG: antibiotic biosynthesis monooxygenase family protein [Actinomycetota bacterium]